MSVPLLRTAIRLTLWMHGVAFSLALTMFRDPRIQTMFDEEHSDTEERWIALGLASNDVPLVVVHTWKEMDATNVKVRLSRRAGPIPPKGLLMRRGNEQRSR